MFGDKLKYVPVRALAITFAIMVTIVLVLSPIPMNNTQAPPLAIAAGTGNEAEVRRLIAEGAQLDVQDFGGNTPLSYAVGTGHFKIAQLLLDKGANMYVRNRQGMTVIERRRWLANARPDLPQYREDTLSDRRGLAWLLAAEKRMKAQKSKTQPPEIKKIDDSSN